MAEPEFKAFHKIPRLFRTVTVTEKIDGTNALVYVGEDGEVRAGSRNRWITPTDDNFGFARFVEDNKDDLKSLGPGYHYGEWWGLGIQRGYGLKQRMFSLFNTARWGIGMARPMCCGVVPVLYQGVFREDYIQEAMAMLREQGSQAVPFMNPEGIMIYHHASNHLYKYTFDDAHKEAA